MIQSDAALSRAGGAWSPSTARYVPERFSVASSPALQDCHAVELV